MAECLGLNGAVCLVDLLLTAVRVIIGIVAKEEEGALAAEFISFDSGGLN